MESTQQIIKEQWFNELRTLFDLVSVICVRAMLSNESVIAWPAFAIKQ